MEMRQVTQPERFMQRPAGPTQEAARVATIVEHRAEPMTPAEAEAAATGKVAITTEITAIILQAQQTATPAVAGAAGMPAWTGMKAAPRERRGLCQNTPAGQPTDLMEHRISVIQVVPVVPGTPRVPGTKETDMADEWATCFAKLRIREMEKEMGLRAPLLAIHLMSPVLR